MNMKQQGATWFPYGHLSISLILTFTLLIFISIQNTEGGGCSRFGHSCFGAHGKRADISAENNSDDVAQFYPLPQLSPNNFQLSNSRISPLLRDWIRNSHRDDALRARLMSRNDDVGVEGDENNFRM